MALPNYIARFVRYLDLEYWVEGKNKHHHIALAYKRRDCIAVGTNSYEDSSALQRYAARKIGKPECKYNHAEVDAINKCNGHLDELLVVRVNHQGKLLNSKPCPICTELLREFNVKRVWYSNSQGGISRLW